MLVKIPLSIGSTAKAIIAISIIDLKCGVDRLQAVSSFVSYTAPKLS